MLHPVDPGLSGIDPASTVPEEAEPALLDDPEETPATSGKADDEPHARPAAPEAVRAAIVGRLSCCVRGDVRLAITASAAVYGGDEERGEGGRFLVREYIRTPFPSLPSLGRVPRRAANRSSRSGRGARESTFARGLMATASSSP